MEHYAAVLPGKRSHSWRWRDQNPCAPGYSNRNQASQHKLHDDASHKMHLLPLFVSFRSEVLRDICQVGGEKHMPATPSLSPPRCAPLLEWRFSTIRPTLCKAGHHEE